jgi:outer membrane protein OmpA-like peptidoglycan-associated protein
MRIAGICFFLFLTQTIHAYGQYNCFGQEDSIYIYKNTVDPADLRVGQFIRFHFIVTCDGPDYSPANNPTMDSILGVLKKDTMVVWEIAAHSDCRATKEYNERLTTGRAKVVWEYLISNGISQSRLTYQGYGESKLLNNCACEPNDTGPGSNCTEAEHSQNRRYELTIIKLLNSNEK